MFCVQEDRQPYGAETEEDRATIQRALFLLSRAIARQPLCSPELVKNYLQVKLAELPHEVFGVLWLDSNVHLIADELLFRGTLTQTSVYPREVVKRALHHNACSVLIYHNHPSGRAEPSRADEVLTRMLKTALDLVDVRLIDHIVVGEGAPVSFAERGLLF